MHLASQQVWLVQAQYDTNTECYVYSGTVLALSHLHQG